MPREESHSDQTPAEKPRSEPSDVEFGGRGADYRINTGTTDERWSRRPWGGTPGARRGRVEPSTKPADENGGEDSAPEEEQGRE